MLFKEFSVINSFNFSESIIFSANKLALSVIRINHVTEYYCMKMILQLTTLVTISPLRRLSSPIFC